MAIISENNQAKQPRFTSTQVKYAFTYVAVTLAFLVFLNVYCARVNEQLFRQNKLLTMQERAKYVATELTNAEEFNFFAAYRAISRAGLWGMDRVIITDTNGNLMYDTNSTWSGEEFAAPDELQEALQGKESFTWAFNGGNINAAFSAQITKQGEPFAAIYILDVDESNGMLYSRLHSNIQTITLVLEIVLILFSALYVYIFNHRLRAITNSMRIIQNGDFSHRLNMNGHDELTFLADEFNYLTERLEISENKRRQFVSDASHELKTPLASIKLLSDSILQNDMDIDTVREFVSDIGAEADRLNRMSQKLLALTKDNSTETDAEIITMQPTIERVVKMLSGLAQRSNISIVMNLQEDVPVLLAEDDLYQIAFNLVENGIKYNVPGGKLIISLYHQDEMSILRVSDTGMGIPEEAQKHVFERFYRVDKARSRQSGGSGLGLAIVKAMVERNNGEISLSSTVGKGTTFTVAFPCFDSIEDSESEVLE